MKTTWSEKWAMWVVRRSGQPGWIWFWVAMGVFWLLMAFLSSIYSAEQKFFVVGVYLVLILVLFERRGFSLILEKKDREIRQLKRRLKVFDNP